MGSKYLDDHRLGNMFLASVGRHLMLYELHKGALVQKGSLTMPLSVQCACFHPSQAIMYVACSNGGVANPGDQHCLAQISLGADALTMVAEPLALPGRPLHAAVLACQSRLALVYNQPASLTVHALDIRGLVWGPDYLAAGGDLVGYFPHQVIPIQDCQRILLTCRGDDASASGKENPGSLRVLEYDGKTMICTQNVAPNKGYGFGPRNCAFHPNGRTLYAVLERQNRLLGFRYRHGTIEPEPCWNVDLLANSSAVQRPQLGGAIVVHPNGQYAYVVNRSHPVSDSSSKVTRCGENSIVVFRLDSLTGEPRELQRVELNGLHARCISLSSDGRILAAALRQPGRCLSADGKIINYSAGIAVFHVEESGKLTLMHQNDIEVGGEPLFWGGFAPALASQVVTRFHAKVNSGSQPSASVRL
jgi:6-phosphogluconolactonase